MAPAGAPARLVVATRNDHKLRELAEILTGAELVCRACGLAYPIRDDIPVLLVDEARRG